MTHILIYTDANGYFGTEQNNHILGVAFKDAGFRVSIAQPYAAHHLVQEREKLGIDHAWTGMGIDGSSPAELLDQYYPDLILFSDHYPFSNLVAKKIAFEKNIPYLVISHSADPTLALTHVFNIAELHKIYLRAEMVIGTSQVSIDLLNGKFGLPLDRGAVIYPGRPAEFFAEPNLELRESVRQELGVPAGDLLCLTIAPLGKQEGFQYLTDAINHLELAGKLKRLHFVWVGEVDDLEIDPNQVKQQTLGTKIRILPPRAEITDLMDAADIFVHPVEYAGSPLVLLEAMAKGLPVIATAVGGVAEIVDETGFLLPDPIWRPIGPILANTIHWMEQSEQLRSEVGTAGAKRAVQYFKAETMVNNYLSLISMMINRLKNKKTAQLKTYPTVQLQDSVDLNG